MNSIAPTHVNPDPQLVQRTSSPAPDPQDVTEEEDVCVDLPAADEDHLSDTSDEDDDDIQVDRPRRVLSRRVKVILTSSLAIIFLICITFTVRNWSRYDVRCRIVSKLLYSFRASQALTIVFSFRCISFHRSVAFNTSGRSIPATSAARSNKARKVLQRRASTASSQRSPGFFRSQRRRNARTTVHQMHIHSARMRPRTQYRHRHCHSVHLRVG